MLHHVLVSPDALARPRLMLFLHGILGTGTNLATLARRFSEARPEWGAVLVDLRAHGRSRNFGAVRDDTLEGCARDLVSLSDGLGSRVTGVFAHSFAGKVALTLPDTLPGLEHLVIVDSNPGLRLDAHGSESTLAVLVLLEQLEGPWPTRADFIKTIEGHGHDKSLAQWLAMNLEHTPAGFMWGLDLKRIRALLDSYFQADLWPSVERFAKSGPRVHLVIGDLSRVYEGDDRERAAQLATANPGRVTVDVLPTGHWVHAEAPDALLNVMLDRIR